MKNQLPIIAVGASAGGLGACRALLKDMPYDLPAAVILILHLDPTHQSMMVDLLVDHTALTVVQASDGLAVQQGHLYVIPPGVFLSVEVGVLHLTEPAGGKSVRLPFDVLLRSVAQDSAAAASACIVLSGTGTDGTAGLAEIHAAGGLVIAQDPKDAEYPGMPESAINTGFVDHILPIEQIVQAVEGFLEAAPVTKRAASAKASVSDVPCSELPPAAAYDELFAFVGKNAAQDLSLYKRGTMERRVARRMSLGGFSLKDVPLYLETLRKEPEELEQLTADLLIHVTSFFRDPKAFDHLAARAIPDLLAEAPEDRPLRIWVAGCSTGEEAYSLGILCLEALEKTKSTRRIQILASDIDPDAITAARAGFFPKEIESMVSAERLAQYFVFDNGGWRVTSALRDTIVFTVADLLLDPPFSRIDLVSCRNVMIYLGPEAQKRVVARCCFALRPGGLLLLGAAEMPGPSDSCFALENKSARLWRRVGKSQSVDLNFAAGKREEAVGADTTKPVRQSTLAEICRRVLLKNYAPAAVLINAKLECLFMLGPTEKYLRVGQGLPDKSIANMLPKVLRARFRAAAAGCTAETPVVNVLASRILGTTGFDIAIHAISSGAEPLMLACFIDVPPALAAHPHSRGETRADLDKDDLEADLEATRSDLSDALRELEQEVEAHSADAAEALSLNEEFQSTNEELLASKEELQSLNEELTALNSQLQETLERHRTTADDLQNVLYSTDVATLFLDMDLNIRFFTPSARNIFNVIPSDVGRPLSDLASVSADPELIADSRLVLDASGPQEREVHEGGDRWFMRRVQPYLAEGRRVEGVVITYVDITERKRINAGLEASTEEAERATRAKSRFLAAASHDLRQPLQAMALLHSLLARQKRSVEGARLAHLMDQTLHSMTGMLDSMLDVNRIESGVVQPNMRRVAIGPIMQTLADEFRSQCELKNLKLRFVPCKSWVRTDPQLLEQMLRNLMSNAVKYTPHGKILLGCHRSGPNLKIMVCDTGIGVSRSEIETIFEAYQQGENATALAGAGLGLGLSIVQRLGQLMEYPVSVRSIEDKGSTFAISLPLAIADEADALTFAKDKEVRQTGTVVLIEDLDHLRDLLEEVLVKEGHKVLAFADAKSAIEWASGDVDMPDFVLADYDLHGKTSGLELVQKLTEVLGGTVPSIILTGDITTKTMQSISASSSIQFSKPVIPEVLLFRISDMMRKDRGAQGGRDDPVTAGAKQVYIIDPNPIVRESMRRLFETEGLVVDTFMHAEGFLAVPRPQGPGSLLVDSHLPGMDGITLIKQLRDENSELAAIMLTGHGEASTAVAAMKAGASDLIEKPVSAAQLLETLRNATPPGKVNRGRAGARKVAQAKFSRLTKRENDVLVRVLKGEPNKIIAAELGINQRTVENHRAAVMRKTGADSLAALVRLALLADMQPA